MKQVNNYLKNGALIIVVVMLLVIPNFHVYSSIGSYQIASSAISVNIDKKKFHASCTNVNVTQNRINYAEVVERLAELLQQGDITILHPV